MGKTATIGEKTSLEERRIRLQARIDAFHRKVEAIINEYVEESAMVEPVKDDDDDEDQDWYEDEFEDKTVGEQPENIILAMPSSFGAGQCQDEGWQDLLDQEMELRTGQANDCLEKLRVALGHKMILFKTRVRDSTSQRTRTRAWAEVNRVDAKIRKMARSYKQARRAMVKLGATEETLARYQVLKAEDLKLSGDIMEENRVGQRNDKLAWFWQFGRDDDDDWMQERKCLI
jgi:hypothetical protein